MRPTTINEISNKVSFVPLLTNSKRPVPSKSYNRKHVLTHKQKKKYEKSLQLYQVNREKYEKDARNEKITILAYWSFVDPYMEQLSENCGSCWMTNDRNFEHAADAIIFDNTRTSTARKLHDMPDFHSRNLDSQYWIWWPRESAAKGMNRKTIFREIKDENNWDGCMNLTVSYRQDSDVIRPFGTVDRVLEDQPQDLHGQDLMDFILKIKTEEKHTAWMVSDCDQTSAALTRWEYANRLIDEGLKLDGYGKCFNRIVNSWKGENFLAHYKFYLAFENAFHCTDYISEKFWRNALSSLNVPIVFGPVKEDVEKVAPKGSFIFAEDFETPKDLVDYLDFLDSNDTAYLEYHKWRVEADFQHKDFIQHSDPGGRNLAEMMCNMCGELQTRKALDFPKKIINSTASWWWRNLPDESCHGGVAVPNWLLEFPPQTMEDAYDEMRMRKHEFQML